MRSPASRCRFGNVEILAFDQTATRSGCARGQWCCETRWRRPRSATSLGFSSWARNASTFRCLQQGTSHDVMLAPHASVVGPAAASRRTECGESHAEGSQGSVALNSQGNPWESDALFSNFCCPSQVHQTGVQGLEAVTEVRIKAGVSIDRKRLVNRCPILFG